MICNMIYLTIVIFEFFNIEIRLSSVFGLRNYTISVFGFARFGPVRFGSEPMLTPNYGVV